MRCKALNSSVNRPPGARAGRPHAGMRLPRNEGFDFAAQPTPHHRKIVLVVHPQGSVGPAHTSVGILSGPRLIYCAICLNLLVQAHAPVLHTKP